MPTRLNSTTSTNPATDANDSTIGTTDLGPSDNVSSLADMSSFATAQPIPTTDFGTGHGPNSEGGQAVTIEGDIDNLGLDPVRYPGGPDQPGERNIPTNAITDGEEGSPDNHMFGIGSGSVTTLTYYFPASELGKDANGIEDVYYPNLISPVEKTDVREIFDMYAHQMGIEVEESTTGGIPVFVGDPRGAAFPPTRRAAPALSGSIMRTIAAMPSAAIFGAWRCTRSATM